MATARDEQDTAELQPLSSDFVPASETEVLTLIFRTETSLQSSSARRESSLLLPQMTATRRAGSESSQARGNALLRHCTNYASRMDETTEESNTCAGHVYDPRHGRLCRGGVFEVTHVTRQCGNPMGFLIARSRHGM